MYGQIGDSIDENGNLVYGISGSGFAYELRYLQDACKKVSVRINSVGGSVYEAYSIISAILTSKVPVNTFIDGLAASSAGLIAVAGKHCSIMPFGSLMLHNPFDASGGGDTKVLGIVKDALVTIVSERTKKTPEEVSKMMDKETWFSNSKKNADYSLEDGITAGFFDEILSIKKPFNKLDAINSAKSLLEIQNVYQTLNKENMTKITNKLGLNESASEEAIVSEIEKKDQEIAAQKERITALEKQISDKAEAEKAELKNAATELAKNAEKLGKIKPEEVENTIANASRDKASFEFVSNMLSKMTNSKEAVKVFNSANAKAPENKEGWSLKDWEEKDLAGLKQMFVENRAKFDELAKDYATKK